MTPLFLHVKSVSSVFKRHVINFLSSISHFLFADRTLVCRFCGTESELCLTTFGTNKDVREDYANARKAAGEEQAATLK